MVLNLDDYVLKVLELVNSNSFTSKVFLSKDNHLSSDIIPHDVNEMLEYLLKKLFNYGC